eukprot:8960855-Heterocapsa_arctica.AAC.1
MPAAQVDPNPSSSSSSSHVPVPNPSAIPSSPPPPADDAVVHVCVDCEVEDQLGGDGNVGHRDLRKDAL